MFAKKGNIKIGASLNGLPSLLSSINITKPYKENGVFVLDTEFEQDNKSVCFKLPYVNDNNFHLNFKVIKAAFVKIKNFKYMFLKEDDKIIAYPLDIKKGHNKKLPKIEIGLYDEWSQKLSFNEKGILECLLIKKEVKEGDENTISGDTYLFKTSSTNSILEINEILSIINTLDAGIRRFLKLKLELYTKMHKKGNLENVTYARIQMPSDRDILLAKKMSDMFGNENNRILSDFEDTKLAKINEGEIISKEDFEKEFGAMIIEEDSEDDQEFMVLSGEQKENISKKDEELSIGEKVTYILENIYSKDISENILKSMINKYGVDKTIEIIKEEESKGSVVNSMAMVIYMGNN